MPINRIYHAIQQVGLASDGSTSYTALHGVQSFSMATNFQIESINELGQLEIYDNVEQIPDVEISLNRCLDGYPLAFVLATKNATTPTISGRAGEKCMFAASIFNETQDSASGAPLSEVVCSGMFVGGANYRFPVQGTSTEELTLVGNNKVWARDPDFTGNGGPTTFVFTGAFSNNNDAPLSTAGVARRENIRFLPAVGTSTTIDGTAYSADPDVTILPQEIWGISSSGTNDLSAGQYGAHIQNISVSATFNRDALNELGRRGPYTRNIQYPFDVTTEVEVIAVSGDMVSATEDGIYTVGTGCVRRYNTKNRPIRIAMCEGTRIFLGNKNRLQSVNESGGDAGGGNATITYSFKTNNRFTVMHSGDPNSNYLWANRSNYLV